MAPHPPRRAERLYALLLRLAMGADRRTLLTGVIVQSMSMAAFGALLGLVIAAVAVRILAASLYGVHPNDPVVFGSVIVILLLVALVTSYLPARRAASIDPVSALRQD